MSKSYCKAIISVPSVICSDYAYDRTKGLTKSVDPRSNVSKIFINRTESISKHY